MIVVLGDLLLDISLRLPDMRTEPKDLHRVTYLELGPGGAANVAITAARLGLPVCCLGEVGDDRLGTMLLESLRLEGIDTARVVVTTGGRTPVATVLVDERAEPAYLGFRGRLNLAHLPEAWTASIQQAEALFCDGWAEYAGVAPIILESFRLARAAGVPVFFDPGPGNPELDNSWHLEAAALSRVVVATDAEAGRLSGLEDPLAAAQALLERGPDLVILKRGAAGCLLLDAAGLEIAPGYPVTARDTTGAGDSFVGAVIYGYLGGLAPPDLGILANATGAAKVLKLGTGHNMPRPTEIQAILDRFDPDAPDFGLNRPGA